MLGLAVVSTSAQTPDLRKVAATGPDYPGLEEQPVWETEIAAGAARIVAVFQVGPRSEAPYGVTRIGYAIARLSSGAWTWSTQGLIAPSAADNTGPWSADPDIAYDPTADDFVACCVHGIAGTPATALAVARYSGATPFGAGWQLVSDTSGADYPKIVAARELSGPTREFWITYHGPAGLHYRYSSDGGNSWAGGPITVNSEQVNGHFALPAIDADGALLVSYSAPTGQGEVIRFLKGETNGSTVAFSYLSDANGPVSLTPVTWWLTNSTPLMGIKQFQGTLRAQGQMAPDPTDANVIHVVYNDLKEAHQSGIEDDVNIYYRRLSKSGANWTLGDRVPVNTNVDTGGKVTDQFRPVIVATPAPITTGGDTRLHVLFYDDRDYPDQSDPNDDARANVYYSHSLDAGDTWSLQNKRVYLTSQNPSDPPSLDYSVPLHSEFQLGEYNGIALRAVGTAWEIWASFVQMLPSGSTGEDDFSQIGAVRIYFNQ